MRLYLSDYHLAIDARQRATMEDTYLALINEGAAGEEDRSIILAALFSRATDGVVKDDSAPVFGLVGILSGTQTR